MIAAKPLDPSKFEGYKIFTLNKLYLEFFRNLSIEEQVCNVVKFVIR